ncbi:MAG: hypothetical protein GDA56_14150 [Hormoscilla sp. GM7CHS1pb]|nr:hypothetical protein [Hormoscilla sp. GM7CHS1pb]
METHRTQTASSHSLTPETQIDDLQLKLARARFRGDRRLDGLNALASMYSAQWEYIPLRSEICTQQCLTEKY